MRYITSKPHTLFALLIAFSLSIGSCANWSGMAKGGAIGAGVGGTVGGVIGSRSGNTVTGAILGAAVGGVAGAAIGRYMDKQKKALEEDLGKDAEVERVGEGIRVTFGSGILFDVNKADLKAEARANLAKMAETLKEYKDTELLIEGHTDSSGADDYNQTLSERRAASVRSYLAGLGVNNVRMTIKGYGENQPVANNDTEAGRQQNRRVEVAIYANDQLKKDAAAGKI